MAIRALSEILGHKNATITLIWTLRAIYNYTIDNLAILCYCI